MPWCEFFLWVDMYRKLRSASDLYEKTGENLRSSQERIKGYYPLLVKSNSKLFFHTKPCISSRSMVLVWWRKWYSDILLIQLKWGKRNSSEGIPFFWKASVKMTFLFDFQQEKLVFPYKWKRFLLTKIRPQTESSGRGRTSFLTKSPV